MPAISGPKAHWFYGHLSAFRADRLGFFTHCARTYWEVVALRSIDVRFSRAVPIPDWVPVPSNVRLRRAMRTLDRAVVEIINRRRGGNGNGQHPGEENLLSALLRARDEDGSAMTDAQLLDEVRTIFLAGHETTALALAYSLYLLATNPRAQDELCAELSQVLNGRLPTFEDL